MNPVISYQDIGNLIREEWYEKNMYHRINAPAVILRNNEGNLIREMWCINNKMHRMDGPAFQDWDEEGNLIREAWWINGVRLTDKEVTVLKRKLKLC